MVQSSASPRAATCPACGHHVAVSFYEGGSQPLATLAWPKSQKAARSLPKFHLDFVRCVSCGHVFNVTFDYENVPYSEKPNLMFNHGNSWSGFLNNVRSAILKQLPESPVVVEIGYGDGAFLSGLSEARPGGRYIGFDPNGASAANTSVELRAELFDPARHLAELKPDLIISRHVLEHLVNPLGFLQQMSFCASMLQSAPVVYLEVPCVDAAISSRRTVDFYYEHSSQFTTESFTKMLSLSTHEIFEIGHGYEGEVIFGFASLGAPVTAREHAFQADAFYRETEDGHNAICKELADLHVSGKRVALWGGTGKSAAFMCHYGVDAQRFPVVVDSDQNKAGTFVPGTGQEIRFRDYLLDHDVDVIIIPPQWRAADIISEITQNGIVCEQVLIEHLGHLIDYNRDQHPYRV
ncbi:MAG: methyltransferase domain-containing protein [Rhodospirillales bacterium]|nr:methyltransferase domain-containing protein [Rhodospirillales bacterium]